jgi:hypothetical protein
MRLLTDEHVPRVFVINELENGLNHLSRT